MPKRSKLKASAMVTTVWYPYSASDPLNEPCIGPMPHVDIYHDSISPVTQLELQMYRARSEMWGRQALDQEDLERLTRGAVTFEALRVEIDGERSRQRWPEAL